MIFIIAHLLNCYFLLNRGLAWENYQEENGHVTFQGWRITMEDASTVVLSIENDPKQNFFGVYDGHGGITAFVYHDVYYELYSVYCVLLYSI